MSSQATPPQEAFDTLFAQVHAAAYFDQLGRRGYAPANEKEAQDLLELGGKLASLAGVPKQASSRYGAASSELDNVLSQHGLDGGLKAAHDAAAEAAIQQAAAKLASDPAIYQAVLALDSAAAQA